MNRSAKIAELNKLYSYLKANHPTAFNKLVGSYSPTLYMVTAKKIPTDTQMKVVLVWAYDNDRAAVDTLTKIDKIYSEIRLGDHEVAAIATEVGSLPKKSEDGVVFIMENIIRHFLRSGK